MNVSLGEGPIKITDINCELKDDYVCDLKAYYALIDLIIPRSIAKENLEKYYNNSNIIVMIIEKMCLGIFKSLHIAEKFTYIKNAIKYKDYSYVYENGMKIIIIPQEWDTRKWSYTKILRFYDNLHKFETKNYQELLLDQTTNIEIGYDNGVDLEFLSSLLWNSHLD